MSRTDTPGDPHFDARRLAARARLDAMDDAGAADPYRRAWFAAVYDTAGDDPAQIPWADLSPHPLLAAWLGAMPAPAARRTRARCRLRARRQCGGDRRRGFPRHRVRSVAARDRLGAAALPAGGVHGGRPVRAAARNGPARSTWCTSATRCRPCPTRRAPTRWRASRRSSGRADGSLVIARARDDGSAVVRTALAAVAPGAHGPRGARTCGRDGRTPARSDRRQVALARGIPARLAHDPEKACPGLDPRWIPVFGPDHAQNNAAPDDQNVIRRSDFSHGVAAKRVRSSRMLTEPGPSLARRLLIALLAGGLALTSFDPSLAQPARRGGAEKSDGRRDSRARPNAFPPTSPRITRSSWPAARCASRRPPARSRSSTAKASCRPRSPTRPT